MITNKREEALFQELKPLFTPIPSTVIYNFATDYAFKKEGMRTVFKDATLGTTPYIPLMITEKLGCAFNIARQNLPTFAFDPAPANLEETLSVTGREQILRTMIELGMEKEVRAFVQRQLTKTEPPQDAQPTLQNV